LAGLASLSLFPDNIVDILKAILVSDLGSIANDLKVSVAQEDGLNLTVTVTKGDVSGDIPITLLTQNEISEDLFDGVITVLTNLGLAGLLNGLDDVLGDLFPWLRP